MSDSPDAAADDARVANQPRRAAAGETWQRIVGHVLDDVVEHRPDEATTLGDHRGDDRLPDRSPSALRAEGQAHRRRLAEIEDLDLEALPLAERVDTEILRAQLESRLLLLDDVGELSWDPLAWNPGGAVYSLLNREYAPLEDRLRRLAARLTGVPEFLEQARQTLGRMPRVHLETAVGQLTGSRTLLATGVERELSREPGLRPLVEPVRDRAVAAIDEHIAWLRASLDDPHRCGRDPRLGPELFARKLAYALESDTGPDTLLRRAEQDLETVQARIAEVAARIAGGSGDAARSPGLVRDVLDRLAADGHVDDDTIVGLCADALHSTTAAVGELDLVTIYADPLEIIVMPEIHRGVAVAYCDPPGPLEPVPLTTYFAVAPTPEEWSPERVASFYREYNAHMLHNLTVHEAMPGHALQLAHSRRYGGSTPLRAAFWSGTFVEGWAVLTEEMMADAGYAGAGSADAVRMQQLKMALRMILNTILDVRVHCHAMTESEAMTLMLERGYQEDGEAAGKWRRALMTSTQLSTYYVGYSELRDLAADHRAARPGWSARRRNDEFLAHGSPAPRHLRTLLGL